MNEQSQFMLPIRVSSGVVNTTSTLTRNFRFEFWVWNHSFVSEHFSFNVKFSNANPNLIGRLYKYQTETKTKSQLDTKEKEKREKLVKGKKVRWRDKIWKERKPLLLNWHSCKSMTLSNIKFTNYLKISIR